MLLTRKVLANQDYQHCLQGISGKPQVATAGEKPEIFRHMTEPADPLRDQESHCRQPRLGLNGELKEKALFWDEGGEGITVPQKILNSQVIDNTKNQLY